MSTLQVEIPLKSYLKKFIAKSHPVDPFVVDARRCHISALIMEPLKLEYGSLGLKLDYTSSQIKELNRQRLDMLSLQIPINENRLIIDHQTILRINERLTSLFSQQMSDMVSITKERPGDIFTAIQKFISHYDINDDDLDLHSFVKMNYRATHITEARPKYQEEIRRFQQLSIFDAPTNSSPKNI